jgi:ribosomal protein S27E
MSAPALACTKCGHALPEPEHPGEMEVRCSQCGAGLRVFVFPAYRSAGLSGSPGQPALALGEAVCFFHPTRRAAVTCEECGRLVCSLCDLEIGARHVCPTCLPALERGGRLEDLERQRTRYDIIVWLLLLVPMLFMGVCSPLTAPVALGLVAWKWKAPPSRVDRTRLRMGLAIPVALAELAWGIWFWINVAGVA